MEFTRRFYAVAAALLFTTASFADVTWFHNRDVVADFENFLGLSGDFSKSYQGKTVEGKACSFKIVKKGKKIAITPAIPAHAPLTGEYVNNELVRSMSYFVTDNNKDLNGGFEGNKLWTSYFIDRKSEFMIHGQFGVGFSLELEKNNNGRLTKLSYHKTRMEDLGYFPLGSLVCHLP